MLKFSPVIGVLLISCAPATYNYRDQLVEASSIQVFDAAISILQDYGFFIANADRESGFITTDYRITPNSNRKLRLSLAFVRIGGEITQLKITPDFQIRQGNEWKTVLVENFKDVEAELNSLSNDIKGRAWRR